MGAMNVNGSCLRLSLSREHFKQLSLPIARHAGNSDDLSAANSKIHALDCIVTLVALNDKVMNLKSYLSSQRVLSGRDRGQARLADHVVGEIVRREFPH